MLAIQYCQREGLDSAGDSNEDENSNNGEQNKKIKNHGELDLRKAYSSITILGGKKMETKFDLK